MALAAGHNWGSFATDNRALHGGLADSTTIAVADKCLRDFTSAVRSEML
jgi:hypothetical protein